MQNQNIYDNDTFFNGYMEIRNNPNSYNNLIEKPALFSLCPTFKDKDVLDLGCGYGENCNEFKRLGARHVLGIDISTKMLEVANKENKSDGIDFLCMSMDDISMLQQKFDIILSSLAIHYVEDFNQLVENIAKLLHKGGYFIFSQEHPITTATQIEDYWTKDKDGNAQYYNLSDYSVEGLRKTNWIINDVIKYHRSFSTLMNTLHDHGMMVEKILEPIPDERIMQTFPQFKKSKHKPDFLLMKARKV